MEHVARTGTDRTSSTTDVPPPSTKKAKKKRSKYRPAPIAHDVSGVCPDDEALLVKLLEELDAGLGVLTEKCLPGEAVTDHLHELLCALALKAKAARKRSAQTPAEDLRAVEVLSQAKARADLLLIDLVDTMTGVPEARMNSFRLVRELQCDLSEIHGYLEEEGT